MCARTDAVHEMQAAAECLTKACEGKIDRVLREVFDHVLDEPLPPDLRHLMSHLK
jgi:hypothetical protein